jgi:antitoxin (DNA-binding transcriptional repressor) of toxin-antitoxin stability system
MLGRDDSGLSLKPRRFYQRRGPRIHGPEPLMPVDLVVTGNYLYSLMKAVGVKQLKARLSEYLRHVRAGETILVTDREEVIAELRPPSRRAPRPHEGIDELLDSLAERGDVTRAGLPKGKWTWKVAGLGLAAGTAAELLNQIRSDR